MTEGRPRRICVVSGSRADYGLLTWPMRAIAADPELALQLVVTGMHLAAEFGATVRQIEADGFRIDARVDSLVSGDSAAAITKSIGLGVIGFADVYERLQPDLVLLLGDRFEILAAAQAAMIARIPLAHLCGGDTTEGAFDEMIRHAITKMAHIHLVTNADAANRVRQMGEAPANIHIVGSPGIDAIRHAPMLTAEELFREIDFTPGNPNVLISFHPVTLGTLTAVDEAEELLAALDQLGPDAAILITGANADTEGRALNERLRVFAASRANVKFSQSLGSRGYINALRHFDVLIGNSSSGLYEAPSLGTPTVDIGDRQRGRLRGASVLWTPSERRAIADAMEAALKLDAASAVNPYGDGHSAERIRQVLKSTALGPALLRKRFFDIA